MSKGLRVKIYFSLEKIEQPPEFHSTGDDGELSHDAAAGTWTGLVLSLASARREAAIGACGLAAVQEG